jgi:hypothetical protein
MKFWNRLRWLATIVFVLFLAASWLAADPSATRSSTSAIHRAPIYH